MYPHISPGARFRKALELEQPLQIVGAINALHALMANNVGYRAIYLSGGGLAAGSLGMPDLGLNTLDDVLTDVRRITDVCELPLLVDADTGFGPSALNIARSVKALIKAGAAAMHIEDQVGAKRCGHRPNKEVVSDQEMVDRIKAAVDARTDTSFFIIARTDALATLGPDAAIARAQACIEAGADGIFAEGVEDLNTYQRFTENLQAPVLANLTEFGLTPTLSLAQLQRVGVAMALYPLTIFRVANLAALRAYQDLRRDGTQKKLIPNMQTRTELYDTINYHQYEAQLDKLLAQSKTP
ncbi:MAG TPA: methylisocitrate lyase [Burkholderiaceae bacterium]|nr:methylisocitrate lyase [Burkholderiaceae bacterium]